MPKKFVGENSKSAAAKARKNAVKEQEQAERLKKLEDELWKDDDKHVMRKQQRKEDKEKRKQETLEKKAEVKNLLNEELDKIQVGGKQPLSKVTRAEIQMEKEKRDKAATSKKEPVTHIEKPLEENINLLQVEGKEARTVDEALSILSIKEPEIDRHPEKRMKAAYSAFEEANLPRLKAEYSNMRLSQIKQILRKEWMKSPQNPMNQLHQKAS
ncbi:coiled-coil domain-containing protein 124-like [Hetaerina americana]|uniref:coiled-coil domain-containing protein 124-like n=1 Tax=Hetaerina americana TaxID=62018 RepID=UPI003A7F305E